MACGETKEADIRKEGTVGGDLTVRTMMMMVLLTAMTMVAQAQIVLKMVIPVLLKIPTPKTPILTILKIPTQQRTQILQTSKTQPLK